MNDMRVFNSGFAGSGMPNLRMIRLTGSAGQLNAAAAAAAGTAKGGTFSRPKNWNARKATPIIAR
jgi:hypothetical protein